MLTPDILAWAGRMLYGDEWIGPLSRALKINERNVQRMAAGTRPISDAPDANGQTIADRLLVLVNAEHAAIVQAIQASRPPGQNRPGPAQSGPEPQNRPERAGNSSNTGLNH